MTYFVAKLVRIRSPVAAACAWRGHGRGRWLVACAIVAVAKRLKQRAAAAQKQNLSTKTIFSLSLGANTWRMVAGLHVVGLQVESLHACPRAVQVVYN